MKRSLRLPALLAPAVLAALLMGCQAEAPAPEATPVAVPAAPPATQGQPPAVQPAPAPQQGAAPARPRRASVQTFRQPDALTRAGRRLLDRAIDFVPSLLAALVVLLGFYLLYRVVAKLLHGLLRRTHADPAVQEIGLRLTKIVILAFGVVMAASQLGFEVSSVLAGLGIAGLAVGLAAQDSLSNLVGGITILWDRPFRIGDNVTISGTFGRVQEIGLRATTILTVQKEEAIIPNKQVINEQILNHTRNGQLRLSVPVGIGYGEDTREARRVMLAAVESHPRILPDPAPKVVVTELAESSVNVELRVFLREPHQQREAFFELTELVKIALDEAGIEIPFPQRTLHLADRDLLAGPLAAGVGRSGAGPGRSGGAGVEGAAEGSDVAGWDEVDH
ncbi:MAG TPA: mechanosensitive ion channel family protein [Thermoanaerobaculia bacterium]|nr:mechanosensitive ion channel family protein [Thermoanaerobaculia bacterium]